MGWAFWVRRFMGVGLGTLVILTLAQCIKGHDLAESLMHGVIWAPITAAVFVGGRIYQSRRGMHCAICRDTPETR
ncbi:hypothetical protein EYV96_10540 [Dyella terrae]|uniref:Uncharacterized protein n=2 Tax=Dyella TaxID=231454 RepID=A0A4R0YRD2_9GAMM|nr:hypothetical protein EYV96_10540 [Dyella terrae]TCI11855.1 hypothetical protein EZM97_00330 [Dyella soli]